MESVNLLFLAPHWRVSLLRAFRAARDRWAPSGRLVAADSDPHAPALRQVDHARVVPPFSDPACRDAVLNLCRDHAIQTIVPLTNKAVEFLDAHREILHPCGLGPFLPDSALIDTCHDKWNLAQFFAAHHLPMPATYGSGPLPGSARFPLLFKARRGEGGKDQARAQNELDYQYWRRKYPRHLVQEWVQGREFTIDWFADSEGQPLLIVPRERRVVRGGEVAVSRIHLDPALVQAARTAGEALGLKGPCTLQGFQTDSGRFLFTDVNLRFGSGTVHTLAAGGDIPGWMVARLAGKDGAVALGPVRDGLVMTRYPEAYYFEEEDRTP